ncbi:ABC transporter permease [Demequina zhanjiangensis]|uniref:ABC transporter permease n=1 Tax=Demequina zhanjiangensis TaxID=3051659 RepID=A0ABT8G4J4_9MICO|nr:ABC transporter permease [Demequina sp. SYSU T00b26]MDN4474062.1 ABC transporter permease [Demequina sp. SYSU T00b26]
MTENTDKPDETEGLSIGRIVWGRFVRHKAAMVSAVVLAFTVILVFTSIGVGALPGWWKWGPNDRSDLVNPKGAPTMGFENGSFQIGEHPFGQDEIGRDIFARVMQGAQVSVLVMVIMGVVATTLGVIIGAYAGYYRGWVDNVLMRMTEVVIAIPTLVVTAVVGRMLSDRTVVLGPIEITTKDPWVFGLVLGLLLWPGLARLVRAEYLSLREREFVDAAKVAGAEDRSIMFRHILPNAMGVIIVNATLLMAAATILEASLSFLGFGIQAPNVSLGTLISQYSSSFQVRPWLFWWPGLFIITFALTINLIGDGLRDAFDPRQKRIPKARELAKRAATKQESEVGS